MLLLDPLVDNTDGTLEDVYKKIIPECEEIRIATGYFYLSGFDLIKDELDNLGSTFYPEEKKEESRCTFLFN